MSTLTDRLDAWVDAGLVSPEQAERIVAFETDGSRHTGWSPALGGGHRDTFEDTAAAGGSGSGSRNRTSIAEAIGYVGAALALGAISLLLGQLWADLLVGGRLALVGVLTVAVFGAGLGLRGSSQPAMQRLTSVLLTATVAGVGWFVGVVADDVLELRSDATGVTVGAAMLVVAAALYLWRGGALLQLATLGSVLLTAGTSLSLSSLTPEPVWYGVSFAAIGVAWFLLAAGGWLPPRALGEITGALAAFGGVQIAASDGPTILVLAVGIVAAGGLVWLAVQGDQLRHLVVGALALFVLAPQLVFELFGDAIGGPATLLLIGLLLVLLAVGLGRARREVVDDDSAPRHHTTGSQGGVS
ncbi:MAG: hypothetical protein R6V28_11005 [Nitriliruptoraceae bacterium]